ncbi:hypothetical protein [Rhodalgimonas zhirmunskyi]|uniref:Uncharacterized protein n=1 Tax=Rhodalgimonas zhirmunskyi TaxID=2964767 RepID=A0AAJ1UG00_9RHOB|nr:hypothetical protein [Rhodoalgimonas zhirmunskyi]MDQ2095442.1 hypothetical protein [Rhodoalgimonas zhirmunskyi]
MSYDAQNSENQPDLGIISARLDGIESRVDDLAVQIGRIARMATLTAARVEIRGSGEVSGVGNAPDGSGAG